MTRMIDLTQGKKALVDDESYDELNQYKWHANKQGNTCYARRNIKLADGRTTTIRMHRQVLGMEVGDSRDTDHINRNGLDNRLSNLRLVDHATNSRNRKTNKNNTSGYPGITWHAARCKWQVNIKADYKLIYLGLYTDINDAIQARKDGENKYWR